MRALLWKKTKTKAKKDRDKRDRDEFKGNEKAKKKDKVKMMMKNWKGENVSVHLQFEEWQFSAKILQRC